MLSRLVCLVVLSAVVVAANKSNVVTLTSATFKEQIAKSDAVLVDFYAPWCGHCKTLEPIYEKLAGDLKGRGVVLAKVDCISNRDLQNENGIRHFPTIKLFKNGGKDVVEFVNNARDGPTLTAFLEREKALTPIQPPHLRYFDSRGRAELIRLILEEVGEKYEDTRFTWEQWLASEKPNTNRYAFAQAPQLTIDNQELVQSGAIIRYLARKYKLYAGDENNAQTQVDLVIGGFEDLRTRYNQLVYDKEFAAKRAEFETKVLPTWLPHFERLLLNGGSNGQFFVGGQLSIADLEAFDVLSTIWELTPNTFNGYPALSSFIKSIAQRPNINRYLKSTRRPKFAHGSSAFFNNEANPAVGQLPL